MSQPTQASLTRLEEIVGAPYVVSEAAELVARDVCGVRPSAVVSPADAAQIAEIVRFAGAAVNAVDDIHRKMIDDVVGTSIEVVVIRGTTKKVLSVKPASDARPKRPAA